METRCFFRNVNNLHTRMLFRMWYSSVCGVMMKLRFAPISLIASLTPLVILGAELDFAP